MSNFREMIVTPRRSAGRWLALTATLLCGLSTAGAQPLVVETDPLSPARQREKFHLPPGFEIQLVASEPDIGQPMNMNFDARGRLWVTSSVEYPYPVAGDGVELREAKWGQPQPRPGRDWVTVLSGIDDTGKPASIQRFAEGLNIPIGIIPEGDGAIIYSIPHIERFRDTDGDGQADQREKLFGPFGNVDTHGMVNSFTRGLDGWIYACHGFRNTSRVQGTDGHVVEMNSGNTFRFKPDGSRIEHWTHGQVNPFGLCFDPWGNLYSADCHSKPLTCLLRRAYYPSFGKPHDGLGFGPDMIDHNHGSTGICGCAWYEAPLFPAEHNGCIFLCNPVTGRVHRDKIEFRGSSPWAVTQPDFITCDDGWFRPVDVKLGPDGALYIADFYNAIIGHYEVPLEHPRRDRTHGRIWRVVYRGESSAVRPMSSAGSPVQRSLEGPGVASPGLCPAQCDLVGQSDEQLIERLGDVNFTLRTLAAGTLADGPFGDATRATLQSLLTVAPQSPEEERRVALAIRILSRRQQLPGLSAETRPMLKSDLAHTHWLHSLDDSPNWSAAVRLEVKNNTLSFSNGHVRRAAVEIVGAHPFSGTLGAELTAFDMYPTVIGPIHDDSHYLRAIDFAMDNQLMIPENLEFVLREKLFPKNSNGEVDLAWVYVALAMHNNQGAKLLLLALPKVAESNLRRRSIIEIARYGDIPQLEQLLLSMEEPADNPAWQIVLSDFVALIQGLRERGGQSERISQLHNWGTTLAMQLLDQAISKQLGWTPVAHGPNAKVESAFGTQTRPFADGQQGALLHSSFPLGEAGTGILRSDAFDLPPKLSFFIAGHNGLPSTPEQPKNLVRLCDAATGQTLREALPPRNDTARLVEWDLADISGRRGYVEIVDGDDRPAYAWLSAGRFSIEGLNPVGESPQIEACKLVADLKLIELAPRLTELVRTRETAASLRHAAAGGLLALRPDARLAVLREAAGSTTQSQELREKCYVAIAESAQDAADVVPLLRQVIQSAPADTQRQLAMLLASDRDGAAALLDLVHQGVASPRLLQDALLVERLRTWSLDGFDTRLTQLTADIPAPDAALATLLAERRERYRSASRTPGESVTLDVTRGRALFKQHCAVCHQIGGEGAKIGPQLDGIGVRGADRLLEDILDPNRNVDAAFRMTVLVLEDGRIVSGLVRREEGATLVLADHQGKELSVATAEIELRKVSALSLMPAQLVQQLEADDLSHLVQYLLTERANWPASRSK